MNTKTVAIYLLFSCAFFDAAAQWRTGVKGGINLSWFTQDIDPFARNSEYYEDYIGFKQYVRAGISAGITLHRQTNSPFSFGAELLYTSRGAMYRIRNSEVVLIDDNGETSKAYDTYTYRIDFAEIPLYVQMEPEFRAKTNFAFYAGLAPAYAFNAKRIYRYYDVTGVAELGDRQKRKKDLEDVRALNFFPLGGIKIGGRQGYLDLRVSYPFFPTFARTENDYGSNLSTRTWSIGAAGGLYF